MNAEAGNVGGGNVEGGNELIEFCVANMQGNASVYACASLEELRVKLAVEAGVLAPCVVLLKQPDHTAIADSDDVTALFPGDNEQPYAVIWVNNEEGVKQEVRGWSGLEWHDALGLHVKYGDENFIEHAKSLMAVDTQYRDKMGAWSLEEFRKGVDRISVGDRVKVAIALDLHMTECTETGYTLLHLAAHCGCPDIIALLVEHGMDANKKTDLFTPLHLASSQGHVEAISALLLAGASVDAKDRFGRTPLYNASFFGQVEAIRALLLAGACVVAKDFDGRTPLHHASSKGYIEAIRALLHAGACLDPKDNDGKTPLDYADNKKCKKALSAAYKHKRRNQG